MFNRKAMEKKVMEWIVLLALLGILLGIIFYKAYPALMSNIKLPGLS
ncbi:MAG: hypothetical protein V1837_07185 [Candidatus Woesearchaeota archaeon]